MPTNLAILGIDDELMRVMELERIGKAPWCKAYSESRAPRRKPAASVKLKSTFSGKTREITIQQQALGGRRYYPLPQMLVGDFFFAANAEGHTTVQTSNALTSCIANCKRKTGFKFKTHRSSRGVTVTRIA